MKTIEQLKMSLFDLGLDGIVETPKIENLPADGKYNEKQTIDIPIEQLGPLMPAFTKIELEYQWGVDSEGTIYLALQYHWEHHRGSNGLRVEIHFDKGGMFQNMDN